MHSFKRQKKKKNCFCLQCHWSSKMAYLPTIITSWRKKIETASPQAHNHLVHGTGIVPWRHGFQGVYLLNYNPDHVEESLTNKHITKSNKNIYFHLLSEMISGLFFNIYDNKICVLITHPSLSLVRSHSIYFLLNKGCIFFF